MSNTSTLWRKDAGSARPDEWGSAVRSGDATKLAELVLLWSGSKPEPALSILKSCVSLLEKEVEFSAPAFPAILSAPTTPGPNRNSCLKALIVALNETCDRKSWYTSTKELQLASMEFCMVCRNYQTVHLNVGERIPRRLLAAADAPQPHPKRLFGTRVPRLRARRVMWNMQTAAELRNPIFVMTEVDCLEFGEDFDGGLETVAWPRRLKTIVFCEPSPFNQPLERVQWPAPLQNIILGESWNHPVEHVAWPSSLHQLAFGEAFNQPIERAKFPASLKQLTFHNVSCFNKPITDVVWPETLEQLTFGGQFNQPIERVKFPASLKHLTFHIVSHFNQPIANVVWPETLEQLTFGERFNQPIERATFSASLLQLNFGEAFDQPIEGVLWPDSLQRLVFGVDFNRPVNNVRWPASLQEVMFGWCDPGENNEINAISWFDQRIDRCVWPISLRRLTLGSGFSHSLEGLGTWMPNLEALRLLTNDLDGGRELWGIEWPENLSQLALSKDVDVEDAVIPSTVEVLHLFNDDYLPDLDSRSC